MVFYKCQCNACGKYIQSRREYGTTWKTFVFCLDCLIDLEKTIAENNLKS